MWPVHARMDDGGYLNNLWRFFVQQTVEHQIILAHGQLPVSGCAVTEGAFFRVIG